MKICVYVPFYALLLFLNTSITGVKVHSKAGLSLSSLSKKPCCNGIIFQDYFTLQKFYPGYKLYNALTVSEQIGTKIFVTVTNDMLNISGSLETITSIEEQIDLIKVYNNEYDDAEKGKCCFNVKFQSYPAPAKCNGTCPNHLEVALVNSNATSNTKAVEDENTYCVDIFIFNEIRWRLCNESKEIATNLHMNILMATIRKQNSDLSTKALLEFTNSNFIGKKEPAKKGWNWENQLTNWNESCNAKAYLQSPINMFSEIIETNSSIVDNFKIDIAYKPADFYVVKNGNAEIFIQFLSDAGYLTLTYEKTTYSFQPTGIYFRVPADHTLNGQRYDGEIVITHSQIATDQSTWVFNNLEFIIPMKNDPNALDEEEIEILKIDFWQFNLNSQPYYRPRVGQDYAQIDLNILWSKVSRQNPTYYTYLGSKTTPPCESHSIKLIVDYPLHLPSCLLKQIENNSLASSNQKVHTRLLQNNCAANEEGEIRLLIKGDYANMQVEGSISCDTKEKYVYSITHIKKTVNADECKPKLPGL